MASVADGGHFFEGTEKLLEVWFESDNEFADLRTIKREQWEELLENVHCQVLSVKSNDDMMAFVLSESSMFISKQRFILKTCGKTTLLAAVKPLLRLVKDQCGFEDVVDVFYSRKNFLRPELQHSVHQSFEEEVTSLDELFENGTAYALGRINKDCWYLYTIDYIGVVQPDQTLEVLMQDLDPQKMALFSMEVSRSAAQATKNSGIADLIPGAIIDDFLFEPCGYSMNGILPKGEYFTIHITPEPQFSYVSFETNASMDSYVDLVKKVLSVFSPGKFLVTLFANEVSEAIKIQDFGQLGLYHRSDHQVCQLKNYNLIYSMYVIASERRLSRKISLGDIQCLKLDTPPVPSVQSAIPEGVPTEGPSH